MAIPDHKDVVVAARAKYASLPPSEERAAKITEQVAWDLRGEGAGGFYKPSGTNVLERSIDVIIYKHRAGDPAGKGASFDILGDAEGKATPQWTRTQTTGWADEKNWREPRKPSDVVVPPPVDPPPPSGTDYRAVLVDVRSDLEVTLAKINDALGD